MVYCSVSSTGRCGGRQPARGRVAQVTRGDPARPRAPRHRERRRPRLDLGRQPGRTALPRQDRRRRPGSARTAAARGPSTPARASAATAVAGSSRPNAAVRSADTRPRSPGRESRTNGDAWTAARVASPWRRTAGRTTVGDSGSGRHHRERDLLSWRTSAGVAARVSDRYHRRAPVERRCQGSTGAGSEPGEGGHRDTCTIYRMTNRPIVISDSQRLFNGAGGACRESY